MTHTEFLQAAIEELSRQCDELRSIHEAAIRGEDWREARYTQLRMWAVQTDRLNMECALDDLKGA